jgi:hypothetical protein
MTQKQAVIELFKTGEEVDALSCFKATGCMRLSAKVFSMKELGYFFDERTVFFKTRFKTMGHLKKYKLNLKKTPKSLLK